MSQCMLPIKAIAKQSLHDSITSCHSFILGMAMKQQKKENHYSGPVSLSRSKAKEVRLLSPSLNNASEKAGIKKEGEAAQNITLIAKVTIRRERQLSLQDKVLEQLDSFLDLVYGQKVLLQLVSVVLDSRTGVGRRSTVVALQDWADKALIEADKIVYVARFIVNEDFGRPGAITVVNSHSKEFFMETVSLEGWPIISGRIYFPCYSWIGSEKHDQTERIFFSNESFLPWQTPAGLRDLREKDMASLRGAHSRKSQREPWDRIYEYDTYNDIGNPDKKRSLARPTLGGAKNLPYPRRCRTGRPLTKTEPNAESVGTYHYVPRDEAFEEVKQKSFDMDTTMATIHQLFTCNEDADFNCFNEIHQLYSNTNTTISAKLSSSDIHSTLPSQLLRHVEESTNTITSIFKYAQPQLLAKDKFAWLHDEEFGRQVLAGANPVKIERLTSFPPVSNLEPSIYGPAKSALTPQHLQSQLGGLSVEEALEQKRLFILDYHDVFMPFINKINALEDRKMYASRTILFLTALGTLMPIAIELSLPPPNTGTSKGTKRVFTPDTSSSNNFWLWQLAKAHVSSNDAGFLQLSSHWLRSHAVVEPYIIATHRNLSCMHPIHKLLHPHFRYTLHINAAARQLLINAEGVIENCFTPGLYSLEISSAAYDVLWRFDCESLVVDLLARGMALENPSMPEGIELVIEDYPYAADGLLIYSAIKSWVKDYVSLYYSNPKSVMEDQEIQKWWREIKEEGHADKAKEPWWPKLANKEDLENILSTMIWVASGFHAAVNFGQYEYGAYVPSRPCMMRKLIPDAESAEYIQQFSSNPEKFFLSSIPNQKQATTTMSVLETLSNHSPDEEYLGQRGHANWTNDAAALQASLRFKASIQSIEDQIRQRNRNPALKNRNGVGVHPYDFLVPSSSPGRTGRGVPNSISI